MVLHGLTRTSTRTVLRYIEHITRIQYDGSFGNCDDDYVITTKLFAHSALCISADGAIAARQVQSDVVRTVALQLQTRWVLLV